MAQEVEERGRAGAAAAEALVARPQPGRVTCYASDLEEGERIHNAQAQAQAQAQAPSSVLQAASLMQGGEHASGPMTLQ